MFVKDKGTVKKIKGYKAMNSDMTCLEFKFKVGKIYQTDVLKMCSRGFHFCENVLDVYNHYEKSSDTVICEVEALGRVQKEEDKSVTDRIKIIRKLSDKELLEVWIKKTNSGDWNSGNGNSGNWNSGNWNSGNRNSGHGNSGNWNSGNWNSGNWNSGNRNSGNWNSGNWNSGNWNSGNGNSGNWNSGNGNSGYFNTISPFYLFNKPSEMKYRTKEFEERVRTLNVRPILQWVSTNDMTDEDKINFPAYKVTGGFLRKTDRHDWRYLTEEDKNFIRSLPNFDDAIFQQISGVSLSDDVEVIINGQTKRISKVDAKKLGLID